jgi:hypothetical protein
MQVQEELEQLILDLLQLEDLGFWGPATSLCNWVPPVIKTKSHQGAQTS